jgi:general secretion pathway protein A
MYEEFYGFRTRPFSILPDADFLYLSKGHRFALSLLEYGLGSQTGFTVITGEIGSGKTTLVQYLLQNFAADHTIGHITNTAELNADLLKWLLHAFGVHYSGENKVDLYQRLVDYIKQRYSEGHDCVLIIDEAQHLTAETLESLRLLSNINSGKDHLLKILLVGQPELSQTLARPDLVQFAQRISTSFHLKPLSLLETREYIRNRLKIAGGAETLFDDVASDFIHLISGGVPRQINILCDTALVYGYADGQRHIDLNTVIGVLRDRASGQRVNEPGSIGALDRDSIEKMIKQTREKEFSREATQGISQPAPSRAVPSVLESTEEVVREPLQMNVGDIHAGNIDGAPERFGRQNSAISAATSSPESGLVRGTNRSSNRPDFFPNPSERLQASIGTLSARKKQDSGATVPKKPIARPFQIYPVAEGDKDAPQQHTPKEHLAVDGKEKQGRSSFSLQRTVLLIVAAILVIAIVVFMAAQHARSSDYQQIFIRNDVCMHMRISSAGIQIWFLKRLPTQLAEFGA